MSLCARGAEDLNRASEEVQALGREVWGSDAPEVTSAVVDVTNDQAVTDFVAQSGPVDLLLVKADAPPAKPFDEPNQV